MDAESLGWNLGRYVEERRLGLLDVTSYFAGLRAGKKGYVDVRTVVADLAKHVKRINARRIVIDPMAPLVFAGECLPAVQEYVRSLTFAIEDNLDCTTLVTSGIPAGTSSLSRYGVSEFVSEGVVVLSTTIRDDQRIRTIFIRKMRSTATDLKDHTFEILPTKGIVIKD